MFWLVMQAHELIGGERQRRVRPSIVVAEFDFVDSGRKVLDDCADLTTEKSFFREFLCKSHDGQHLNLGHWSLL